MFEEKQNTDLKTNKKDSYYRKDVYRDFQTLLEYGTAGRNPKSLESGPPPFMYFQEKAKKW